MAIIGSVLLVDHEGRPSSWPIQSSGENEQIKLYEAFESLKKMCEYEIKLGGCLKLIDINGKVIEEVR